MSLIRISLEPNPAEIDKQFLRRGMIQYNLSHLGEIATPCSVFARNENNEIVGGASVLIYREVAYLELFWIMEPYRGNKIGHGIMDKLIKLLIARNIQMVYAELYDFQGVGFYLKQDFKVIGILKKHLLNHDRFFLKRQLELVEQDEK